MCELLAVSASHAVRPTFSLRTLAAHGSAAGRTHDGWGVAFYKGLDVALFREPVAAATSPLVRLLESDGPATTLFVSHIRRATRGRVALANTQPFARALGGRMHVFAHNGHLSGIEDLALPAGSRHRPVGQTDSERAFCLLLARLEPLWSGAAPPSLGARLAVLAEFATALRPLGPANFLYADGEALFAHAHRRRQVASQRVEAPGLWWLPRRCVEPAGTGTAQGSHPADAAAGVALGLPAQAVLLASVPLSAEPWQPLAEGELIALRDGERVAGPA